MTINQEQYDKIKHLLPIQHGNVSIDNITFINALLYICENGCKWRRLPKEFGNWHVIYKRFRYWLEKGYIERLFTELCVQSISQAEILAFLLDSMTAPVHPDACGALKKRKAVNRPLKRWLNHKDPHDGNRSQARSIIYSEFG